MWDTDFAPDRPSSFPLPCRLCNTSSTLVVAPRRAEGPGWPIVGATLGPGSDPPDARSPATAPMPRSRLAWRWFAVWSLLVVGLLVVSQWIASVELARLADAMQMERMSERARNLSASLPDDPDGDRAWLEPFGRGTVGGAVVVFDVRGRPIAGGGFDRFRRRRKGARCGHARRRAGRATFNRGALRRRQREAHGVGRQPCCARRENDGDHPHQRRHDF